MARRIGGGSSRRRSRLAGWRRIGVEEMAAYILFGVAALYCQLAEAGVGVKKLLSWRLFGCLARLTQSGVAS